MTVSGLSRAGVNFFHERDDTHACWKIPDIFVTRARESDQEMCAVVLVTKWVRVTFPFELKNDSSCGKTIASVVD